MKAFDSGDIVIHSELTERTRRLKMAMLEGVGGGTMNEAEGCMLLGVVSDSHGQVKSTQAAVRLLASRGVDAVLHCGDIGSAQVVPLFARWPTHFVFGNVDHGEAAVLREAIELAGQTCHGRWGELELEGVKIAFLHSDDEAMFRDIITSGKYGLVCYGHTHVAREERIGPTVVLNPGALHRASPPSFAIVELPGLRVSHVSLS